VTTRAFLGIDCGTGSIKASVVDADSGELLALGRCPTDIVERPDGTSRQHPDWWVAGATRAIREALAAVPSAEVTGIGVSGQQHGLVSLDVADRPVGLAPLWNDTTSADHATQLSRALGGPQGLLELTGNTFQPGFTAPALYAMRLREPDAYAAARRFCLPHDWLNLWLTGEFATEPGDASGTAYMDVRTCRYQPDVLAAIDPERHWEASLPPIGPSLRTLGLLRPALAAELGLPWGLPVSAGGGDNMCSALGAGAIGEGHVIVSLGTSGTAFAHRDAPAIDPLGEVAAFCSSDGGWLPLACVINATAVTDWVRELFGMDRRAFEDVLRTAEPGADGLSFLPYMAGERTPALPRASGTFIGLRLRHRPRELVRAVTEGVTFGLAHALSALGRTGVIVKRVSLVGGGAASDGWAQLCADAFGVTIGRPVVTETAAIGAALQARWVVDGTPPSEDVAVDATWQPRHDERLVEARARHDALRESAKQGHLG
jgi:xylulokinase